MISAKWEPMRWEDAMSVGIARLDDDHKGLISIINRIGRAAEGDRREQAALPQIFAALERYTRVHFSREEAAMRAAGYDDFAAHHKGHEAFIDEIDEMRARFESGRGGPIITDLSMYLRDWLTGHIMVEDQAYRPSLSNNDKARKAAEDYSETETHAF
jgi:hemerythrin